MADIAKLKMQAASLEADGQLDTAIRVYREILSAVNADNASDIEIPLYSRVGDGLLRQGQTADAVTCFERVFAVDLQSCDIGARLAAVGAEVA